MLTKESCLTEHGRYLLSVLLIGTRRKGQGYHQVIETMYRSQYGWWGWDQEDTWSLCLDEQFSIIRSFVLFTQTKRHCSLIKYFYQCFYTLLLRLWLHLSLKRDTVTMTLSSYFHHSSCPFPVKTRVESQRFVPIYSLQGVWLKSWNWPR